MFEDPVQRSLWLGKGTPRAWWAPGESIVLTGAATRYGRVSYAAVVKAGSCSINVTVPSAWSTAAAGASCTAQGTDEAWCAAPRGGLMVRVRLPGGATISSATIGRGAVATAWGERQRCERQRGGRQRGERQHGPPQAAADAGCLKVK